MKATMPINSSGAVSPSACAMPIIDPVNMPGIASGITWCKTTCILDAPMPSAASRMEGGTLLIAARLEMMIVGNVIKASTSPPTTGTERGIPNRLINTARPSRPKMMEGTAARLLMFTSIKSVSLFCGANSSRYTAAAIPMGKEITRVTSMVNREPTMAPRMPALPGLRESPPLNRVSLKLVPITPFSIS